MRYGWRPDIPDCRDKIYQAVFRANLPDKVDLRNHCSPVENQSDLGSCTANALAGAMEYLSRKDKGSMEDFSRLFIYYNERVLIYAVDSDSGAYIRDGIKTLVRDGVCLENLWPYDVARFTDKPPDVCYDDAKNHQVLIYQRIMALNDLKSCLADGFPVVFGFSVYESFESDEVARTGILNMPSANERLIGGHAVMAVGYDDSVQRIIVRNSWGVDWGMAGYFTMPYDYIINTNLSDDFWTIRRAE